MSDKIWLHYSDCAVHNEPAYPAGPCSCSRPAEIATCTSCGDHSPLVQRIVQRLTAELAAAQAHAERLEAALEDIAQTTGRVGLFPTDTLVEILDMARAALAAAGGDGK